MHGALVAFARDGDPGWAPNRSSLGPTHVFDDPERNEWDVYASSRLLVSPQS